MKRLQKDAILIELADQMKQRGSWCGETHLQKATYFLQDLFEPDLEFDFVLYKHGPFSFELRDELAAMRIDGLLKLQPQPYPYGPTLATTDEGEAMKEMYPKTLKRREKGITFVADWLGQKDVNQLEKIATALYVTREKPGASVPARARRLHELKPHVSIEAATTAVEELDAKLVGLPHAQAA